MNFAHRVVQTVQGKPQNEKFIFKIFSTHNLNRTLTKLPLEGLTRRAASDPQVFSARVS